MGAFAGMLSGLSGALEQEHQEQFNTELAKRKALTEMFLKDAHDPNLKPWHQMDATRRLGMLLQTPYNKKLPGDVENLKNYGMRPAQTAQPNPQQAQPVTMRAPVPPPELPGSAPGGKPDGVLQGGANQVSPPAFGPPAPPEMQPQGPPPPLSAVAGPQSITTIAPPPPLPTLSANPTNSVESAGYSPAERDAQAAAHEMAMIPSDAARIGAVTQAQITAQKVGAYQAFLQMGMKPEQAQMAASGLASKMAPTPVNVMTNDGQTVVASKHLDPATNTTHFYNSTGADITPTVVREIGLAVMPKAEVLKGLGGLPFAIKRPDGTVVPVGDARLTEDEKALLSEGRKGVSRSTSSSSTTDSQGNTSTQRTTTQTPSGSVPPPRIPSIAGVKPPSSGGGKLDFEAAKIAARDAAAAAKTARPMVNLLDTAEAYTNAVNSGKQKADSAHDLSLIVQAVRAMNPGTVRLPQTEIALEASRGTYGQQFQRWVQGRLVDGTLPTQFRNELMGVIRDETTQVAKDAAQAWQGAMKNQELPPHLQRFAQQNSDKSVQVKDPRGVVHTFPDQASADAFKKAAGIR